MMLKKSLVSLAVISSLTLTACSSDDGQNGLNGEPGADAVSSITLNPVGRAVLNPDGAAEILQYHAATQTIYAINSSDATVEMIDASSLSSEQLSAPTSDTNLSATPLTLPTEANGVALGGANSIAVHNDLMAVAIEADAQANNGFIIFYNGLNAGTPVFLSAVEVGNLPDMVTFTPDGSKVIVANEGEPSGDYSNDPEGTIAVISVTDGTPATSATIIDFTSFNGMQSELEAKGLHFPNPSGRTLNGQVITTTVAQDLEPEYITASNDMAYVTLQENNGLALVDLSDNSVQIIGLGYKDWSGLNFDGNEDGTVSFGQYDGLYGAYMPDTIASFSWNGAPFLITANEGDAREYFFDVADEAACVAAGGQDYDEDDGCLAFTEEVKLKNLTAQAGSKLEALQASGEIDDLRVTNVLGDADGNGEYETAVAYGARSFTVWDQNGLVVFDSGDEIGRITAALHGNAFNNGDDENEGDSRSENKGAEPEALTVGTVGDKTYAFIGLERMGGIMVYDVTNPYNSKFETYVINRDLTEGLSVDDGIGDLAPESLVFVAADSSPTSQPLLLVGNEVSGSLTVWEITAN
ncbi:collagen-like protein [Agarivorans sp. B2Z047]|uniref:choice-of-anchor I family protein n=1 Tax=Agarivorans sp. B2Z047 TaxID=2652721 RepID=UPI00128C2BA3|nr:choice-of-anchor I family protein [Agarivorans sp. B2Z047]MPW27945.1 collagen-like protein [Agarivorans sp. B2Z047]UQN44220.1 choice-of-anchor I family protein [Agarivorans sp. B2Z047]